MPLRHAASGQHDPAVQPGTVNWMGEILAVSDAGAPISSGHRARRARGLGRFRYALHALVLIGLIAAAVKYLDGDGLWAALRQFDWRFAPAILGVTGVYLWLKGSRFVGQLRPFTDAEDADVMQAYVAGQACTLLPGGVTARAGLLRQIGTPVEDSAASIALASASDQAALILCAIVSALWVESVRKPVAIILTCLVVISLLLGVEATRTWLLARVERLMGKIRLLEKWRGFLESLRAMCTPQLLRNAVANALGAAALMVLALALSAKAVGVALPLPTLILAFALPSLLGRISAMPAGVGVTEAGMIGILDAAPGVTAVTAAAATMIFRIGTTLFAAMLGGSVYFLGWRRTVKARNGAERSGVVSKAK